MTNEMECKNRSKPTVCFLIEDNVFAILISVVRYYSSVKSVDIWIQICLHILLKSLSVDRVIASVVKSETLHCEINFISILNAGDPSIKK